MARVVLIALCLAGPALALTPKDPPYGQLSVKGGNIVGANGQKVQLAGMSLYWSQWMGQYWTRDVVNAIKCQWNANLVRAAMGVQADLGGYLANKAAELAKLRTVVEAAIEAGIYVIIDWHDHEGASHRNDAIAFFEQMARDYGKYPHVIYETFNEPLNVDWVSVVKPYHEAVLKAIRAIDADNLVVLGTPDWSGSPEKAKASPVSGTNILYTVHFYTGADASWQEFQRNRVAEYVKGGFPIFITEYGVSKEDGGKTGGIYTEEANKWFSMLDSNKIAYANWAMDDAPEASAALKPGTSPTAVGQDSSLTDSGKFIKAKLRSMNLGVSCSGSSPSPAPAPAPVPSPPASGSGKVAVSVKQTASWSGGGQADIVVTNNGDAKVCGATLQLSSGKIASFWNLVSSDNKNFTPQYQMSLAKGQSYTAGGVFEGAVPTFKVASTKNC